MPDPVQIIFIGFAQGLDVEFFKEVVQDTAMQGINVLPRQLAPPHAVHCRSVASAPFQGELSPVYINTVGVPKCCAFGNDGTVPVYHCAEDIEGECFDVGTGGLHAITSLSALWYILMDGRVSVFRVTSYLNSSQLSTELLYFTGTGYVRLPSRSRRGP